MFGFQGSMELHEQASFAIGFALRDGNGTNWVSIGNRAAWKSESADWQTDGAIELHATGNLFDAVDWDGRVMLGYADGHYHGLITDITSEKELFRLEGHGQYGMSPAYW